MKLLEIEIGVVKPEPSPRLLDQPISARVETTPKIETDPRVFKMLEKYESALDRTLTLSEKWERHLAQSQTEKYTYANLYESTKKELETTKRILTFREAQIEGLKRRLGELEEPKLPRMVSHKPAPTVKS